MRQIPLILAASLSLLALPALADFPTIEKATALRTDLKSGLKSGRGWTFSVILSHPDTGWDHYADGWEVLAPDGTLLGTRKLVHPHVNEQPFTRSLAGVRIPAGVTQVQIRAHGTVDGWAAQTYSVQLPAR